MKKILFLMQLPPPIHGAAIINKTIQDSQIVNSEFTTRYVNISPASDLSDIGKLGIRKLLTTLQIFISASKIFLLFKPDLVYMTLSPHGLALYKDGLLAILIKILGGRVVYHLHGKGIARYADNSAWRRLFYRWIFSGVAVIHLSERLFYDVENVRDKSMSITAIANGITPLDEDCIALKDKNFTFVYLSNLIRSKGADILVRGAELVPKEYQDLFRVKIIGKSSDAQYVAELKHIIEKNPYNNIKLLGPKYGQEKLLELTSSHVFVLPTKNDCFPLAIIEAMAAGLPVISTNEGAIPEIVDPGITGELLTNCTPEALAQAMTRHIVDRKYSDSCAKAGHEKFNSKYTGKKFEEKLTSILRSLIN